MVGRRELPWDKINKEVNAAALLCTNTRYVSSRAVAEFVLENQSEYPMLANTHKCTTSRITMSMRRQKWEPRTSSRNAGKQKVFTIPESLRRSKS